MTRADRRTARWPGERGSITPFAVIAALAILLLAALVIDGGRQLNAKGRAVAYAQEAARAGSQSVDVADPRLDLIPALALQAASDYCRNAMAADPELRTCVPSMDTVSAAAGTFLAVKVTARVEENSILLGLIAQPVLEASGQALARPVSGISGPDSGKQPTAAPPTVIPPGETPPPSPTGPTADPTVLPCTPRPTRTPKPPKPPKPTGKPGRPSKPPTPTKPPRPYCPTPSPGS